MMCSHCDNTEPTCRICGERIIEGQEFSCLSQSYDIYPLGHEHAKWCCNKNGITKRKFEAQRTIAIPDRPIKPNWRDTYRD